MSAPAAAGDPALLKALLAYREDCEALHRFADQWGGYWSQHPDYPVADWRAEVAADNTREGYWTWVAWEMSIAAEEEEPAA